MQTEVEKLDEQFKAVIGVYNSFAAFLEKNAKAQEQELIRDYDKWLRVVNLPENVRTIADLRKFLGGKEFVIDKGYNKWVEAHAYEIRVSLDGRVTDVMVRSEDKEPLEHFRTYRIPAIKELLEGVNKDVLPEAS